MTSDMLRLHKRCKALALAAMSSTASAPVRLVGGPSPPAASPGGSASGQARGRCRLGPGLTAREAELLAGMPPSVASHLAATLKRLGPPLPYPTRRPACGDRSTAKRHAAAARPPHVRK